MIEINILRQIKDIRNQIDKILLDEDNLYGLYELCKYSEEIKKFLIDYYKDNKEILKCLQEIRNLQEYNDYRRESGSLIINVITIIFSIIPKNSSQKRYDAISYLEYLKVKYENLESKLNILINPQN